MEMLLALLISRKVTTMGGRSGKTSSPLKGAEPKAATARTVTTASANWWEQDLGKLLRESEAERKRNGSPPFDKEVTVHTGYPARYQYEGADHGQYVANWLNDVIEKKKVNVRFLSIGSTSLLRADDDNNGAERIKKLIEQLGKLKREPFGKQRQDLVADINKLLAVYGERSAVFADAGQSDKGSRGEIVFQREAQDFVVVDSAKLRQAVAWALAQGRDHDGGKNPVLKDPCDFAELISEAIERAPTAEEHRVLSYVKELAACDLLHKLRPCDCGCCCERWLFQMSRTHTLCKACSGRGHINDDMRTQRNAKARHRYHLNNTRNVL